MKHHQDDRTSALSLQLWSEVEDTDQRREERRKEELALLLMPLDRRWERDREPFRLASPDLAKVADIA